MAQLLGQGETWHDELRIDPWRRETAKIIRVYSDTEETLRTLSIKPEWTDEKILLLATHAHHAILARHLDELYGQKCADVGEVRRVGITRKCSVCTRSTSWVLQDETIRGYGKAKAICSHYCQNEASRINDLIDESIVKRVVRFMSKQRRLLQIIKDDTPPNIEPWQFTWRLATTHVCDKCGDVLNGNIGMIRHKYEPSSATDCTHENIVIVCGKCAGEIDLTACSLKHKNQYPVTMHYDTLMQNGWKFRNVKRYESELQCGFCGRLTAWKINTPCLQPGHVRCSCSPACTHEIQGFNSMVNPMQCGKAMRFIWRTKRRLMSMGIKWNGPRCLTEDIWHLCEMLDSMNGCPYCGIDLRRLRSKDVSFDHIVPLRDGGIASTNLCNLVVCCTRCNVAKGGTLL